MKNRESIQSISFRNSEVSWWRWTSQRTNEPRVAASLTNKVGEQWSWSKNVNMILAHCCLFATWSDALETVDVEACEVVGCSDVRVWYNESHSEQWHWHELVTNKVLLSSPCLLSLLPWDVRTQTWHQHYTVNPASSHQHSPAFTFIFLWQIN